MNTPKVTQTRPPWWRLLLLVGCCELLPFTREGFGSRYYHLLIFAFVLRAVLLIPFPTVYTYANFQIAVAFLCIVPLQERLHADKRPLYLTRDAYEPGHPGRILFLLRNRSIFFLFVVEPFVACVIALFLRVSSELEHLWTEPFFMLFFRRNPSIGSVFDLPLFLQSWLAFGNGILEHANPTIIANGLLWLLPLCTLFNSIAEYRAEHVAPPAPVTPKSNAPVLTFPEVRA